MKKIFLITAAWALIVYPAAFAAVPMPAAALSFHAVPAAAVQKHHAKAVKSHRRARHSKHRAGGKRGAGTPAVDAGNTSKGDTLPPVADSAPIIDNSGGVQ